MNPKGVVNGWTVETYAVYNEALRNADKDLQQERDRRYMEVNIEKEKALKIKETADLAALGLAREIQTYKDEKANQLREQINSERGHYVSQAEFKPVVEFVTSQQARSGITSPVIALLYVVGGGVVTYLITEVLKH